MATKTSTRFKKAFVSACIGSELGRSLIIKLIGKEGAAVLSSFKEVAAHVTSKVVAKEMKQDTMKVLSKFGVLCQDGVIEGDRLKPVDVAVTGCCKTLLRTLDKGHCSNVTYLQSSIARCCDSILPLLKGNTKERNWTKLVTITKYYASDEFLAGLLNDPAMQKQRDIVALSIKSLLQQHAREETAEEVAVERMRVRMDSAKQMLSDGILNKEEFDAMVASFQKIQKEVRKEAEESNARARISSAKKLLLDGTISKEEFETLVASIRRTSRSVKK